MTTSIHIKNMVCDRCIRTVSKGLKNLGYEILHIDLGEALIEHEKEVDLAGIRSFLLQEGFDLLEDRKKALVAQIKAVVIRFIHPSDSKAPRVNFSHYLANELKKEYHYLSSVFSQTENITLERYVILQRIERVKELLIYDELTLTQIAKLLDYSNVAYLSSQFKQVTGFSPRAFKRLKAHHRTALDMIK